MNQAGPATADGTVDGTASAPVPDASAPAAGPAAGPAAEPAVALPDAVTGPVRRLRRRWTRVDTAATAVVAVQAAATVALLAPGGLYIDDLRAQAYAQGRPIWPFVVESNRTHLSPVPRVLDWLQSRLAPLELWPAVTVTVAVRVLLLVALWSLLRRLFGPRWAALVPLVVVAVTPALVPASAWYRQSITALLAAALMVVVLDAFVRWGRRRRPAHLVVVAVGTLLAVCSSEKAVVTPVAIGALSLAVHWPATGSPLSRLRGWLRVALAPVLVSGAVVGGFVAAYTSGPFDEPSSGGLTARLVAETGGRALGELLVPMLLGGPWTWSYPQPFYGTPDPATGLVVAACVLAGLGLVVAAVRAPGRVARAAVLLLPWFAASLAVMAVGRISKIGTLVAADPRFWTDLVVALPLAAAVAVLPLRTGPDASRRARGTLLWRRTAQRWLARRWFRAVTGLVAVALAAGVVGGAGRSWATFAGPWWDNPTQPWVEQLRASLAAAGPQPRVVPSTVPADVVPAWVQPDFSDAPLVLLMRPDARVHDADGPELFVSPSGRLVAADLAVFRRTVPTDNLCLAVLQAGAERPVRVPFPSTFGYVRGSMVELGLLVNATTEVDVVVEDVSGALRTPVRYSDDVLFRGPHTVRHVVPLDTRVAAVHVSARRPDAGLCVASLALVGRRP